MISRQTQYMYDSLNGTRDCRKRLISFAMVAFLYFQVCNAVNAQSASHSARANDSDQRSLASKAERHARPAARYDYLIYDLAVPSNAGLLSQTVKQRLPVAADSVTSAVPISTPHRKQIDPNRIPQSWELPRPSKSIIVEGNNVLLYDEDTRQETVLIAGPDVSELQFSRKFARTALSPSGRKLAAAILRAEDYQGFAEFPLYDIYVVDLLVPMVLSTKLEKQKLGDEHKPKLVRESVRGDSSMGSSWFLNALAPPLIWADEQTVVFATPNDRLVKSNGTVIVGDLDDFNQSQFKDNVVMRDDEILTPTHDLITVNTESRATQRHGEIKLHSRTSVVQADFWRRSDGAIMMRNRGKDMRIDLKKKKVAEDRRLSPLYELRGDRFNPSLWHGDEMLCDLLYYRNVDVSPDGRSVAWYTRSASVFNKTNLGNTSQHLTTLWFHSPETGKIEMAEGKFLTQRHPFQPNSPQFNSIFRWISSTE